MTEHKKICLKINGEQAVKLELGFIEFKNYFKQIPVLFIVYADFECILKIDKSHEYFYTENYQDHILLVNQLLFTEVNMLLIRIMKQFLKFLKSENTVKK